MALEQILANVAARETRGAAIQCLAAHLAVDSVCLFQRDAELGVLIPVAGTAQTLRGRGWRQLLATCANPGSHHGEIVPASGEQAVNVVAHTTTGGTCLMLLGGSSEPTRLAHTLALLPLLGAAFRAEAEALVARGEAAVARDAGRQAQDLAGALDAARGELERALADAARLNQQLAEADLRKDEFLALLGHELRNPLAAISTSLEVLHLGQAPPELLRRTHDIMQRQTSQLTRLVDDLLDVARVTRGKITLRPEAVSLNQVVTRAVDTVDPLMRAKQHRLVIHQSPPLWLRADPVRLEQMLTNLLTNAAKYSDPGGHVELGWQCAGGRIELFVRDSGIGIAPDRLESIFDPFIQVSPDLARSEGGMGLGLTLVRELAALHDGEITLTSEVGKGSAFCLSLPGPIEPVAQAESAAQGEPTTAHDAAPRLQRRVLVVDDNVDSAEMIALLLSMDGYEVEYAHDGLAALRAAERFQPDVVILDIGLPELDGHEVARRLRQDPRLGNKRLIALSGYGQAADREKSRAAGFDEHLVKPIALDELRGAMSRQSAGQATHTESAATMTYPAGDLDGDRSRGGQR